MGLEMKVYRDPRRYEAKAMFGCSWRQLGALAAGVPVAGGFYALAVWALMEYRGSTFESASNSSMAILVLLFIPFAVWGWYRPHGLKPEKWFPYVIDYYLHPKELCRGYEKPLGDRPQRDRGSRPSSRGDRGRHRSPRAAEHPATDQGYVVRRKRRGPRRD